MATVVMPHGNPVQEVVFALFFPAFLKSYNGGPGMKRRMKRKNRLEVCHPNAAGIDLGSTEHYVAAPPGSDPEGQNVRCFRSHTPGLRAMAAWLLKCGVDTVAMETTGVYWVPAFEILENAELKVFLVHAGHLKYVPGRKTDVLDCEWIQEVHTFGLLSSCFRPEQDIVYLRTLVRQRRTLVEQASQHILHMQKALDQMNVQVHRAVTDITGKTGMSIIRSILAGNHDPETLASYRNPRCKHSVAEIAKALSGNFRQDYLFTLRQALESYDHANAQMIACDLEIEAALGRIESKIDPTAKPVPPRRGRLKPQGNEPKFELREHLYRIHGQDLTQIEGIQATTVLDITSEVGTDMSRWPTVKHFCSWLALCPGNRKTGGVNKSSKSRKSANRAAAAFRRAASSLSRSRGPLGSYYRRMKRNLDTAEVVTAVAHKLARIYFSMLVNDVKYKPELHEEDPEKTRNRALKRLFKRAKSLGYIVVNPTTGEVSSNVA